MCTVILADQKSIIAEEDIEVIKLGIVDNENVLLSILERFPYTKDVLYKAEFTFSEDTNEYAASDEVETGYECSLAENDIKYLFVIEGFHSFESLERRRKAGNWASSEKTCLFIIPKGASYYKNECGNIVSNQIIFKEILS